MLRQIANLADQLVVEALDNLGKIFKRCQLVSLIVCVVLKGLNLHLELVLYLLKLHDFLLLLKLDAMALLQVRVQLMQKLLLLLRLLSKIALRI